jgi:hypothetical protein
MDTENEFPGRQNRLNCLFWILLMPVNSKKFPARKSGALTAILAVGLIGGCADYYSGGVVQDDSDAMAIAERQCGAAAKSYFGTWHVRLDGGTWLVWHDPRAAVQISIDAKTGKTSGCRIGAN